MKKLLLILVLFCLDNADVVGAARSYDARALSANAGEMRKRSPEPGISAIALAAAVDPEIKLVRTGENVAMTFPDGFVINTTMDELFPRATEGEAGEEIRSQPSVLFSDAFEYGAELTDGAGDQVFLIPPTIYHPVATPLLLAVAVGDHAAVAALQEKVGSPFEDIGLLLAYGRNANFFMSDTTSLFDEGDFPWDAYVCAVSERASGGERVENFFPSGIFLKGNKNIFKIAVWHGLAPIIAQGCFYGRTIGSFDINDINKALETAADGGHGPVVELLLEHETSKSLIDAEGVKGALLWVIREGYVPVIELLLNHTTSQPLINAECVNEALGCTADSGCVSVLKLLLEHAASRRCVGAEGVNSALRLAAFGGRELVVELLLGHETSKPFIKARSVNDALLGADPVVRELLNAWLAEHPE